jgi:hypothetical protein
MTSVVNEMVVVVIEHLEAGSIVEVSVGEQNHSSGGDCHVTAPRRAPPP